MIVVILMLIGLFHCHFCAPLHINPDIIIKPEYIHQNFLEQHRSATGDPRLPPEVTNEDAENLLQEFGFLRKTHNPDDILTRLDQVDDSPAVENALKQFQKHYQLPESGLLDDDTRRLIAAPRCGLAELNVAPDRWTKRILTYKIRSFPISVQPSVARKMIKAAFGQWTGHANLNITEVARGIADIYVSDEPTVHRDRAGQTCQFTSNSTIAHAYFPEVGDIHYNRGRNYTPMEFLSATLHEIGHSLGLEHTTSRTSIMFPMHIRYHTTIPAEDQRALQALYGSKRNVIKQVTSSVALKEAPKLCSLTKMDAILNDPAGRTFILAGENYYVLDEKDPHGQSLSSRWPGLPSNIDAAFTCRTNRTFFFKGNKLWVYADQQLEAGYPKPITDDLPGMPSNLDAAFVTAAGSILALRKKHYWYYNPAKRPPIGSNFPRLVYDFRNMPVGMDAALLHTDGQVYLFKNQEYFIFHTSGKDNFSVSSGRPLRSMWYTC
ncbi:matrix metalloproteinase-19-like [Sabethes cyaneus]|uniref:matrix metalloproteinase-19-like n=1 Tax=Sabethes cyaneus TaxID=53552 RepID=UPI00237E842F|nr:matrix metalloproteinase-19-like [Sabethes cyaneus]